LDFFFFRSFTLCEMRKIHMALCVDTLTGSRLEAT